MKQVPTIILLLSIFPVIFCQDPAWDQTKQGNWPQECRKITVRSTIDGKDQPAYFYATEKLTPQPLIVSLHTWSGGYDQEDPLANRSILKAYNYIHPHFRGPNNSFEACGSNLVIQDIDDAIAYAVQHGNVDTTNIHIVGVSGGGYACLLSYMQSEMPVRTFSAWVPISNLLEWYAESEGRKNKYGRDIAIATTGRDFNNTSYRIDTAEAIHRSPIFMSVPVENRSESKLYLYAGIHDGYTGSVPITHSLKFYNKVVRSFKPEYKDTISADDMIQLLASRNYSSVPGDSIGGRKVFFKKSYDGRVELNIFEGGHEMLDSIAIEHVNSKKILVIGDSNGALENGWVNQLKTIRFNDFIYNTSVPGNTIGFDNLGNEKLNTLKNVDRYLSEAYQAISGMDYILIMLGTNDSKIVFADSAAFVATNLSLLIQSIKSHPVYTACNPSIILISPPPMGNDEILLPKYHGGNERVRQLIPQFRNIADSLDCIFVNVNGDLSQDFDKITADGVHFNQSGQLRIAIKIDETIESLTSHIR